MYKLSKTQYNYSKKQILIIVNQEITETTKRSQMIYKINHKKHVKKILKKFQEKNLYLKLKKYKFHKQQIKYLEHIITIKELKMNSEKIKAIIKFLTSECIKNIQIFQKLAEYY